MPMQPRPSSETARSLPRVRVFMPSTIGAGVKSAKPIRIRNTGVYRLMHMSPRRLSLLAAALTAATCLAFASTASAGLNPAPFGHACTAHDGVRFCPTSDLASRVPSWDKTPIDVDVTLPPSGSGPFPTLLLLH